MTNVEDRLSAARAIGRVIRSGAWASLALRAESEEPASVPTVQALTMGALRHVPWLDRQIGEAARRATGAIDPPVLDLLRVGVHELRGGGNRPPAVIVDTIVAAARTSMPRAAGFVNAVMRRIASAEAPLATLQDLGFDDWLVDRMRPLLGDQTPAFLEASQLPAATGFRSVHTYDDAVAVAGIDTAWLWSWPRPLPPGVSIQDPASVAVGLAVDAGPGDVVLDVAAAPGGKTGHLLEQVGSEGMVVAADRHRRRIRDARRRRPSARWVVADGTQPCFGPSTFDRVLLDAPCTGLGTLRRRPEIRYRVTPAEIDRLAALQRVLLEVSLGLVKPGGRLVYSVCTVTPDETVAVVDGLGGHPPTGLPGVVAGDGRLLGPHLGPTDGMFISVFDR